MRSGSCAACTRSSTPTSRPPPRPTSPFASRALAGSVAPPSPIHVSRRSVEPFGLPGGGERVRDLLHLPDPAPALLRAGVLDRLEAPEQVDPLPFAQQVGFHPQHPRGLAGREQE